MEKLVKNISIIILVFLLISGIFILYNSPSQKPKDIGLSELVNEVNDGKVKQITVESNSLKITLQDGEQQKTTKESEASLTESLKNYGVDTEQLKKINVEVKGESSFAFWAGSILPFLLPFIYLK